MSGGYHVPVLPGKVLEFLVTGRSGTYVDATIGGGGHAEHLLRALSPAARLIGFDADADAISHANETLEKFRSQVTLIQGNFAGIRPALDGQNVREVDGILLDLGVSSFQLDAPGKGFSFRRDEYLDMRMDRRERLDAAGVLGKAGAAELETIFRDYGEERFARRIAKSLVEARKLRRIETSGVLASIVEKAVGGRYAVKSLARIFQALRIAVNDELNNLRKILQEIPNVLRPGGRVVVISYHSLEDRIVKESLRAESGREVPSVRTPWPTIERAPRLRILTKKPIVPTSGEVALNPRARSAKLRAAERV